MEACFLIQRVRSSMSIHYTQDNDVFVMNKDGQPFLRLEEIAVAFEMDDQQRVIVHKHGSADFVHHWAKTAKEALQKQGALGREMGEAIRVIDGPFDVDVLNDFVSGAHRDFVNRYIAPQLGLVVDVNATLVDEDGSAPKKSSGPRP
jgi:hypothetical protein